MRSNESEEEENFTNLSIVKMFSFKTAGENSKFIYKQQEMTLIISYGIKFSRVTINLIH